MTPSKPSSMPRIGTRRYSMKGLSKIKDVSLDGKLFVYEAGHPDIQQHFRG